LDTNKNSIKIDWSGLPQVTASAIHTSGAALEQDSGVSRVVNGRDLANLGGIERVDQSKVGLNAAVP
jgi:hypothetical protein